MKRIILLAAFVLLMFSIAGASPIDEIKKAQAGVKTVKAAFNQQKLTELFDRPIRSEGTFYFKSPVGVRWEYGHEMVVIYDGQTLYLHYLELDEAEKVQGVSGFVGPLSFDIVELLKDYDVQSSEEGDTYLLHLIPKKQVPFETMDMVFAKGAAFPEKVTILEQTGDQTEIRFSEIEVNTRLDSGLFVFTPPPGVEVRERVLR